ncbi:methyltransferase domain-containing protein [Paenibacillaceae bacterium]|nr:methyltransferase domain-containing protein [Paenibacillaceae bacterium]
MDTRTNLFHRMLTITAELFFEMESRLFWDSLAAAITPGSRILDIGAGNGFYLHKLQQQHSQFNYCGLEPDEGIWGKSLPLQNEHLRFKHTAYEQFQNESSYEAVVARLVVPHIEDRLHFARWLYNNTSEQATVVMIDICSKPLQDNERLPLFSELYRKSRQPLGLSPLLRLEDALRLEMMEAGFSAPETVHYSLLADDPLVKMKLYIYMRTVVACTLGEPVSSAYAEELFAWLVEPGASLEIPMFGTVFRKDAGVERSAAT